jgi:hypothetical protein
LGVLLAEAVLGQLAQELVGDAVQDFDVLVLEALLAERVDHLAGGLLVLDDADDGSGHVGLLLG